jgi:hypothetical protein
MENLTIHNYNALTGETTVREMTDEETAEYEALIANSPTIPSPE